MEAGGCYLKCSDNEKLENETIKRAIHAQNILYTAGVDCRKVHGKAGRPVWLGRQ